MQWHERVTRTLMTSSFGFDSFPDQFLRSLLKKLRLSSVDRDPWLGVRALMASESESTLSWSVLASSPRESGLAAFLAHFLNKPTSAFQERLSSESCSSHPEIHKVAEGLTLPAGTSCGVMSNEDTRAWEGLWTTRGLFSPRTQVPRREFGATSFLSMISASGRGTLLPPRQTTQQNPDDEDFQKNERPRDCLDQGRSKHEGFARLSWTSSTVYGGDVPKDA